MIIFEANDDFSGMEVIKQEPDIRLVITDIKMKRMSGMEFIQRLHEELSCTNYSSVI